VSPVIAVYVYEKKVEQIATEANSTDQLKEKKAPKFIWGSF